MLVQCSIISIAVRNIDRPIEYYQISRHSTFASTIVDLHYHLRSNRSSEFLTNSIASVNQTKIIIRGDVIKTSIEFIMFDSFLHDSCVHMTLSVNPRYLWQKKFSFFIHENEVM